MKPADKLRDDGDGMPQYEREARVVTHQLRHDAAALLDECERVFSDSAFNDMPAVQNLLAKLRGEA